MEREQVWLKIQKKAFHAMPTRYRWSATKTDKEDFPVWPLPRRFPPNFMEGESIYEMERISREEGVTEEDIERDVKSAAKYVRRKLKKQGKPIPKSLGVLTRDEDDAEPNMGY